MQVKRPFQWIMLLFVSAVAHAAPDRPNLVLIVTDNQSEQLLGAYGNTQVRTPHIDRLAGQGMRFTRAYASSAVCSPTRATLLTGLLPSQHGVHNGLPSVFDLPSWSAVQEFRSLPQTLADAGYATALVGKYHLGEPHKAQMGFQHWVTFPTGHTTSFHEVDIIENGKVYPLEGEHLTDFWTRKAEAFLIDRKKEQPFFLYLSYNGPYNLPPLVTRTPRNRHAAYYQANVPDFPQEPVHPFLRRAAIEESSVEDVQQEQAENKRWGVKDAESLGEMGAAPELSYGWQTIHALNNKTAMINLASEMSMIDDGVGRVLKKLEELGLEENTIVVFTSDQGSAYGQHGLWGNSSWARPHPAYREHMQIPLLVKQPGVVPESGVANQVVAQYDIFPTLLDMMGLGVLEVKDSPGRSFYALLKGEASPWENTAFFEYISVRAVVDGNWKYIKRMFGEPQELYNLNEDPFENTNLISSSQFDSQKQRLSQLIDDFFEDHANPQFDPWRGGTAKALMMYSDKNDRFRRAFPNWPEPFVAESEAFTDR